MYTCLRRLMTWHQFENGNQYSCLDLRSSKNNLEKEVNKNIEKKLKRRRQMEVGLNLQNCITLFIENLPCDVQV